MSNATNDPSRPRRPLHEQLPPVNVASPSELPPIPAHVPEEDREVRWYKPTLGESLKLLGWKWLLFVPALGVVALLLAAPFHRELLQPIFTFIKPLFILVALPTIAAMNAAAHAIRNRKEPFCIHCGYDLTGLPDNHNCPECGRQFSLRLIEEYRRDPNWFIERYKSRAMVPAASVPFEAGPVRRRRSRDGT
jgi:hypothetical protein